MRRTAMKSPPGGLPARVSFAPQFARKTKPRTAAYRK